VGRLLKVLVVVDGRSRVSAVIDVTGMDSSTYETAAVAWHVQAYGSTNDGPGDVGCRCSYLVHMVVAAPPMP